MLIHDYRSPPVPDPQLPRELLPKEWQGVRAKHLFHRYHGFLVESAEAFVDLVLARAPHSELEPRQPQRAAV
jgi:DNA-binding transcriptional regulator PaaX